MGIKLQLLGEFVVSREGESLVLPASRKTRALLAYLGQTRRPHRRERLCELFWDLPDDPRGALRWSLSKLRSVVNSVNSEVLQADRERVWLELDDVDVDIVHMVEGVERSDVSVSQLRAWVDALAEPLLDGIDLTGQDGFANWLEAERDEMRQLRSRLCAQIVAHPQTPIDLGLKYSRLRMELDPYSPAAADGLLVRLAGLGLSEEADELSQQLKQRFHRAGVVWNAPESDTTSTPLTGAGDVSTSALSSSEKLDDAPPSKRQLLDRQRIRFCTADDGVKIAYAQVGNGPPLVKAANWLNHLELDWDAPIWSPLFRQLATAHTFIRYDERGNGLSDWEVDELSFESFVTDLESVVEAVGLERFPLLGISQGASVSIEYAIRHPERVSHLILFGAYAAGWRIGATSQEIKEREAIMTLTQSGWGQTNPAYRQIFSSTFMPTATHDELQWFDQFQRATTSPDNAVRFLSAFGDIDVRHRLEEVRVPTLVLHSRGDQRIPIDTGREIAAKIPNAEFLSLDSDNHLLLGREQASTVFVEAIVEFLGR